MIRIVCDSAADIPADLLERHSIQVVPLTIRMGEETFIDGVDLTPGEFWTRLQAGGAVPETFAPEVGRYVDTFERLALTGAAGVVVVTMSSEISATYQTAVLAAEQTGFPVRVVDSGNVSMAEGWVAVSAARAAEENLPLSEVAFVAETTRHRVNWIAVVDSLDYLIRGGSIGSLEARFGGMLDMKPVVTVRDGLMTSEGRARTTPKAIARLVDTIKAHEDRLGDLALIHTAGHHLAELEEALGPLAATAIRTELGPVVGTHTGPGTVGIAYRLS